MDVKDVKNDDRRITQSSSQSKQSPSKTSGNQRELRALTRVASQSDSVSVKINTDKQKPSEVRQKRDRVNEVIGKVQEASQAIDEIKSLAESIDGIVAQVETGKLSEEQTNVLASEANQLVDEIRRRSRRSATQLPDGPSDKARLEVEASLGDALDALFPDGEDAFGIGTVKLHPPDVIISVRTNVKVARERIEAIGNSIAGVRNEVEETLVAFENSAASRSSVRDLEQAADLTDRTGSKIGQAPDQALGSISKLSADAVELLKS